jgi:hypothetical protein
MLTKIQAFWEYEAVADYSDCEEKDKSSEMSVSICQLIRRQISEDRNLQSLECSRQSWILHIEMDGLNTFHPLQRESF